MLLHDLTIENFRSFERPYKLNGLARVNLLVGDNNCGKTSVLEAVHILIANGKFSCAIETLQLRESMNGRRRLPTGKEEFIPDVLSFFHHGKSKVADAAPEPFMIHESQCGKSVKLSVIYEDGLPIEIQSIAMSHVDMYRSEHLRLNGNGIPTKPKVPSEKSPFDAQTAAALNHIPAHLFVPSRGLGSARLARLWTELLRNRQEGLVESAMSLVDERIERIVVTPDARTRSSILFDRGSERVSAAEVGEGTAFLFSISVALASSKQGIVLIDEIDTGLHYSRLADMWKMVITAAKNLDVQVFATTHSLDCLNGLSDAIQKDESLAELVAVHRIERSIDEAVTLTGAEFVEMLALESEIR